MPGGQLFRCETTGKNITKKLLGAKIIQFVNAADPHKSMSVHMLRKIAASLNYFRFMDFDHIKRYTGWKSTRVFFKHYLRNIEELSLPIVAAGKVISVRQSSDRTQT